MYAENIGDFAKYATSTGQTGSQLERTKLYDQALQLVVNSDFIQTLPHDTIVHAEMLYNLMAQKLANGLKFVHITYDAAKLGNTMTLVPLTVKQYSTGKTLVDSQRIIHELVTHSTVDVKIVDPKLQDMNVDLSHTVNSLVQHLAEIQTALASRKRNNTAKQLAQQALAVARKSIQAAILNNACGTDILGSDFEGLVLTMPSGLTVKVTSDTMQTCMQTMAPRPRDKTAVVTVGSFVGHRGHQRVVDSVLQLADQLEGDPYVYISTKVGADDPIPADVKLETWHKLYPNNKDCFHLITSPDGVTVPSPLKKIEKELVLAAGSPYNKIILMVGTDRVEGFKRAFEHLQKRMRDPVALAKYGGTQDQVEFEVVEVPRGRELGGITQSFTDLRNAVKNARISQMQKLDAWVTAFDTAKLGTRHIKRLMDITANN